MSDYHNSVTRFIKSRINLPINYATLHKLASRETILSLHLSLPSRSADRCRSRATHRVTQLIGLRRVIFQVRVKRGIARAEMHACTHSGFRCVPTTRLRNLLFVSANSAAFICGKSRDYVHRFPFVDR